MKRRVLSLVVLLCLFTIISRVDRPAMGSPDPGPATVGIWSDSCHSSNITITNPNCGLLGPGNTARVEINATNAPEFNGYEFWLFYDPVYLSATATDAKTGTVFPDNPFLTVNDLSTPGTVRMSVVNLGNSATGGRSFTGRNGTLVHIIFEIRRTGASPLALAAGMTIPGTSSQTSTRLVLGENPIDIITSDGYFRNDPSRLGPVADFTFSPALPQGGQTVTFDASNSFDADNRTASLGSYAWDFGDGVGAVNFTNPTATHSFGSITGTPFIGNFSVRLTVVDSDDRFLGMKVVRVFVEQPPLHDVGILSLSAQPAEVNPGDNVTVAIVVRNAGTFQEVFNLTVTYGPPTTVLGQATQQPIPSQTQSSVYTFKLQTAGLAPTTYTIVANATIPVDDNPLNNSRLTTVMVSVPGNSSFLIIAAGAVVAAVAIVAVSLLLRKRRKTPESD